MDDAQGIHAGDEFAAQIGEAGFGGVASGVAGLFGPGQANGDDTLLDPPGEFIGSADAIGTFDEDAQMKRTDEVEGGGAMPRQAADEALVEPAVVDIELSDASAMGGFGIATGVGDGFGGAIGFDEDGGEEGADISGGEGGEGDGTGRVDAATGGGIGSEHIAAREGHICEVEMGIEPGEGRRHGEMLDPLRGREVGVMCKRQSENGKPETE